MYLRVISSDHDVRLVRMDHHVRVIIVSRGKLLERGQLFQVKDHDPGRSEDHNMRFARIEADFLEDPTAFDEIGLGSSLAKPMDCDNFVFLGIIGRNSQEIVPFRFFELDVSDVILSQLDLYSESLLEFL